MDPPLVEIRQGKLRGGFRININGGWFLSFLAIPYGKPPLGKLRFKAPLPAESWPEIRDATREGDICYSRIEYSSTVQGSEDCLHLNVFTKELPELNKPPKPVMVWIHGGGFRNGSNRPSEYGPEFLMTEDIVLVSINYRLGVFGFLSLEDTTLGVPGNAGLKDQVLALRWVKENIEYFNGDPQNVTIFGESAGSVACHYHVLSRSSKGLFNKAILQSGVALNHWAYGSRNAMQLVRYLGQEAQDERRALEILRQAPVEKLGEAQEMFKDELVPSRQRPFGPVIEYPNESAFITNNVIDIIASGDYNKVPLMIGYTSREGLVNEYMRFENAVAGKSVDIEPFRLEDAIPWQLKLDETSEGYQFVCNRLRERYIRPPNDADGEVLLLSDSIFVAGIIGAVKNHLATSREPIYLYRMSLVAGLNFVKYYARLNQYPGACHGDDLGYLFKTGFATEIKPGSLEDVSIKRFVKLWTNFARCGNPTPNNHELGVIWPPVEERRLHFLDIGPALTLGVNPEADRMALWREIYRLNSETAQFL